MHSLAWVKENFISINSVSLNPKVTSVCPLLLQVVDFLRGEGFVVVRRLWGYQQTHGCRLSTFCSRDKLMSLPAEQLLLLSNTFGVEMNLWVFFGPRPVRFGQGHERLCNIAKPELCSYFNECCPTLMTRPPKNCECRDVFFWPLED